METFPKKIDATLVNNAEEGKRLVRPGDTVDLMPPQEGQKERGSDISSEHHAFLKRWLGNGPYRISWIGEWPCGRHMLYLGLDCGREPGAYASDFRFVQASK